MSGRHLARLLKNNIVPLFFIAFNALVVWYYRLEWDRVSSDVCERFFRNLFLVLSLIIPIVAGLGLNFGIVLGAMAGQIGLIAALDFRVHRVEGLILATVLSIPIATLLGYLTGLLFNKTRGREMITGIILGFFASGVYQFVFLMLAGPVIPIDNDHLLMAPNVTKSTEEAVGMGLRVTIDLETINGALDEPLEHYAEDGWVRKTSASCFGESFLGAVPIRVGGYYWGKIPIATLIVNVLLCLGIAYLLRTRVGQRLRAVGQDAHVAEIAGIPVARCRIIAIILSMVLAGIGQIIFLQNMGTMNTYSSQEQVGFYAIAALLVGGATVSRASIWNAIIGTILFHTLIVTVATAGSKMDSPQVGEYLREFFGYAVIGATLALHAWRSQSNSLSK